MLNFLYTSWNKIRLYRLKYWGFKHKNASLRKIESIVGNKTVIVIGSGPSVKKIPSIPKNHMVACCNLSPTVIPKRDIINLYITTSHAIKGNVEILNILKNRKFQWIGCDNIKKLPKQNKHMAYPQIAQDIKVFKKIIDIKKMYNKKILFKNNNQHMFFSSGVQLILLSILCGAKEVYVSGIEGSDIINYHNNINYDYDPNIKKNKHMLADNYALKSLANNKYPVYALIPESPIAKIIQHKTWENS